MKQIAGMEFPETIVEAAEWQPVILSYAFSAKVLAVARTRVEGKWAAYIGDVPGKDHDIEKHGVLDRGAKLPKGVACMLFPVLSDVPYAH